MSAALLIANCNRSLEEETAKRFEEVAAAFPRRIREMERTDKTTENARAAVWSHAAGRAAGFAEDKASGSWLTLVGNPAREDLAELEGAQLLERLLADRLAKGSASLEALSPPFVVVFHDGQLHETHVITDRCGLQHVYARTDSQEVTWISSSALALTTLEQCSIDNLGITEWLGAGHFISQRTFFREIRKLGCGERIVVSRDKVRTGGCWAPDERSFHGVPQDAYLAEFQKSLAACVPAEVVASELTGGVDSRLVLAGLIARARPFFAWTLGNPGSVELRTIERLKRKAPFEHIAVSVPADELIRRLPDLVLEKHELGDGEENALQYAPLRIAFDALEGSRDVSVSGVPGELVRGFYLKALRSGGPSFRGIPMDGLMRLVVRDTGGLHRLVRPEVVKDPDGSIRSTLESFLSGSPLGRPEGLLEDFYLRVRMQRFAGRGTTTTGLFCRHALPYFGNDLVELALALPYDAKRDGRVIRRALMKLSPALASVPRESGIAVTPTSWRRPDLAVRQNLALARKAVVKFGGPVGRRIASPEPVPWAAVRRDPTFREFTSDLLLSRDSRIADFLDASVVAPRVQAAFQGQSMFALGLLMTLELTLRRVGSTAAGG